MPATDTAPADVASSQTTSDTPQAKWKYATKTALSLTLAYLIPMAMSWPQPSTAAITVMLITATGLTSDSLQKGVMRVLGTVAGAIIGLTLIAVFPQERMAYLVAASITVSVLAYLYNAYQGDSTLFMLAAVVTLMVFNGGDAEGAFIYGVDRAFMTAFGVIVYTVVASTLWPVRAVDNSRRLAAQVAGGYHRAFNSLLEPAVEEPGDGPQQLAELLASEEAFQTHFASIKRYSDNVEAYLAEWNCVAWCYEEMQSILLPAMRQKSSTAIDYSLYLDNYPEVLARIESMFRTVEASWQGEAGEKMPARTEVSYRANSLRDAPHLTIAAVATRVELLDRVQMILMELASALDSMLFDRGRFQSGRKPKGKPVFIWLDLENLKTSARMFFTFWLACAVWIYFNPPMGFSFVALSSILVLLVSYTPVTPKLLFILLTLGFMFALPAYVFLLPNMSHWLELALFMFAYAFIGFFVFQGPVSIFFLLGLFALGIQNTMSYNFDVILLIVISFYLMCTLLIITEYFPFTSKPERLYAGLVRRFFKSSAVNLGRASNLDRPPRQRPENDGSAVLAKLHLWSGKIDKQYFSSSSAQAIARLNKACALLHAEIEVLSMRRREFSGNRLIASVRGSGCSDPLAALCHSIAGTASGTAAAEPPRGADLFDTVEVRLANLDERLDNLRRDGELQQHERTEIAQFYVYLNLRAAILDALHSCRQSYLAVEWDELARTRF